MFLKLAALLHSALASSELSGISLDFFLVQDLSSSYDNDLPHLVEQIPQIVSHLAFKYPASKFGFGSFVDKPFGEFGYAESGDYCYQQHLPLTKIKTKKNEDNDIVGHLDTKDQAELRDVLNNLTIHSGKDWKENQLGALLHAILSPKTGWDRMSNDDRVSVVALATDAGFHVAGDGLDLGLKRTIGAYKKDPSSWCTSEDYPSLGDIQVALDATNTKLLLLVTPDMVGYYKNFMKSVGEDYGVVVALDDKSEHIAEAVAAGLEYLHEESSGFGIIANHSINKLIQKEEAAMKKEQHDSNKHKPSSFKPQFVAPAVTGIRGPTKDALQQAIELPQLIPDESSLLSMCHADTAFDVMIIQDASDSYASEISNVSRKVKTAFAKVSRAFPGSRYGLVSFVDKPVEPFGFLEAGDYCAALRVPLGADHVEVSDSLSDLIVRSGADWKESQLHAVMHAALSRSAGWRGEAFTGDNKRIVRVAITITDAGYHEAGDSSLMPNNGDHRLDCVNEDYPTTSQVGDALRSQLIFPSFLVTDDVMPIYEELLHSKLKVNGTVFDISGAEGSTATLEKGILLTLASVCNQKAISSGRTHETSVKQTDHGTLVHLNQSVKYLAVVAKD